MVYTNLNSQKKENKEEGKKEETEHKIFLLHYFLFIIHVNTRGGSAASFDVRTMV
jgi:hypothetical protein